MEWFIEDKSLRLLFIILCAAIVVLVILLIADFVKRNTHKDDVVIEEAPKDKAPVKTYQEEFEALDDNHKDFVKKLIKHAKDAAGVDVKEGKSGVNVKANDQLIASLKIKDGVITAGVSIQLKLLAENGYKLKPVKVVVEDKATLKQAKEIFDEAYKNNVEIAAK